MEKFVFADGVNICLYDNGEVKKQPSKFIENYKATAVSVERSKEWKRTGTGAQFRGDVQFSAPEAECEIGGVYLTSDGKAAYSFKVGRSSGIYVHDFMDEKTPEVHIINSIDYEFSGGALDKSSGKLAVSMKRNYCNADLALFDLASGNYVTVTDGDTIDDDPCFSPENPNEIYFSSRGVGRDLSGNFAGFSPAAICKLNLEKLSVDEVVASDKFSYFKPIYYGGKLYAIKAPVHENKPNIFLSIVMIPVRFVQAIANLISAFINAFTGKSATSGGSNPAKGRDYDSRNQYVKGNLINFDKEMKKNASKSDRDFGFMPRSWQLVEVGSGEVIKSGVADYDITADGTFIVTNGKHIFAIKDKKTQKLCDTDACLKVAVGHCSSSGESLFKF